MNRRKAIRNLGLFSGGLILLPSCDLSKENVTRVMNNLQVTQIQESILKKVLEVMIPETDQPGGLALRLDAFIWVMVDDCATEEQQQAFVRGISEFEEHYEKIAGESFDGSTSSEKERILGEILAEGRSKTESDDATYDDVKTFLEVSKSFAVMGFMRSEYIMTEVMPYTLVPGRYPSCRTVKPDEKANPYA